MEITLRRSQQVLLNSKASLLESAEDAGARPVYGCRIGMCKTCSCTKVSGVVRDLVTGAIDDQPNTQIRICVTEPLSAVRVGYLSLITPSLGEREPPPPSQNQIFY
jgi:ferredoxin